MAIGFCEVCWKRVQLPHYVHEKKEKEEMKKIVFMVLDTGVDGRQNRPIFASYDENERDDWMVDDINRAYYIKTEKIVDVDKAKREAELKLDAVDKLMLNIWQKLPKRKEMK